MIGKITGRLIGRLFAEPAVPMGMKNLERKQPSVVNVTNFTGKADDLVIDENLLNDLGTPGNGPGFIETDTPLTAGFRPEEMPLFEQVRKRNEKEFKYETKEQRELKYKIDALKRELEIDELTYEMRMRL
ncbi:MAG: hypothetical protein HY361_00600 [Candidatus Aenigmarchaeota archaeon]|nr:hypothetical protein [Candidatus Aenigmarchaeota archaeon]